MNSTVAGSPSTNDSAATTRLRVTVLSGGPSAEREVSLQSGAAIAAGLRRRGHAVHVSDIDAADLSALDHPADVVFPALHGTFGEDGTIQRILESRSMRFVGSGSAASALAIDKVRTKERAIALGIPTPEYEVVSAQAPGRLGVPVVVKPIDQGSSVLTSIVHSDAELEPAVQAVVREYGRALVERFIHGQEVTVGVLGDQTLPPIFIRAKSGFYDYDAKYRRDDTEYLFDDGTHSEAAARVSAMSRALFDALGCRHLGRVDWMLDAHGAPWLLEVNTLPGFTSHSLVPKAAARVGLPFDELVDRLVRLALVEDRS